jgi:hypothetical protein
MSETYTITRLEGWTEDLWQKVIVAVEDTVVAVAEDWERGSVVEFETKV